MIFYWLMGRIVELLFILPPIVWPVLLVIYLVACLLFKRESIAPMIAAILVPGAMYLVLAALYPVEWFPVWVCVRAVMIFIDVVMIGGTIYLIANHARYK